MIEHPYYPSEEAQANALAQYDEVEEALNYLNQAHANGELTYQFYTHMHDLITTIKTKGDTVKYRVTVPAGHVKTTTNSKNQLVGVPDLGEAEHYIMTPEEFTEWIAMWQADGATGQMAIIEQVYRG